MIATEQFHTLRTLPLDLLQPQTTLARPPTSLQIKVVRDIKAFAALRAEWGRLLDEGNVGVFNSWEWLYPWYTRLGKGRKLFILTARHENGTLAGVMPLCMQSLHALGHKVRRLAFLGDTEVCGDHRDIVALPEEHDLVGRAFAAFLRKHSPLWDILDLADMDSGSALLGQFTSFWERKGFACESTTGDVIPALVFQPGVEFGDFLKAAGRKENYTRRRKWLGKRPGFAIERVEDPDSLAVPFSEFLYLHSLRWAGEGSEAIRNTDVEAFHRDATALLAQRGKLQLFIMRVEGKPVAAVYGIKHSDTFSYYQAGRDPEWQNRSVGLVMLCEAIRVSMQAGLQVYDFLRGEEGYKSEWANSHKHLARLRVYSPGGTGRWLIRQEQLSTTMRQLAERVLSEQVKERLKHLLRERAEGETSLKKLVQSLIVGVRSETDRQ